GPDPMPIVMEVFAPERFLWRRPAPKVVIDGFGNWLRTFGFANARAAFVTEATGADNLAKIPVLEPLVSLADAGIGTDLDTSLDNPIVFASCFDELPSFPNVVRNGFFDIHVFAGLNGPNRGQ